MYPCTDFLPSALSLLRRRQWLAGFGREEQQLLVHHRVSVTLGSRFASPCDPHGLRAKKSMPATVSTVLHYSNTPEDTVLLYTTVVDELAYLECNKQ